jgi:hypothetical protein
MMLVVVVPSAGSAVMFFVFNIAGGLAVVGKLLDDFVGEEDEAVVVVGLLFMGEAESPVVIIGVREGGI